MDENRASPEVVVGTDGTPTALRAVGFAATEARLRGLPLRIVHAAPYATPDNTAGVRRARAIVARAFTVARRLEPAVAAHTAVLPDPARRALVDASEGAELLVVGMLSRRPEDDLVSSVATGVSAEARCPVTVVRGHEMSPSSTGAVVLGLEDVSADAAAVDFAFADAQRHRSRVVALHARGGRGHGPDAAGLEEDLSPWLTRHPGVPMEVRVTDRGPDEELLDAAAVSRMLVVAGRERGRERGRAARAVLGSTSRNLVRHSACPVTVVYRGAGTGAPGRVAAVDPGGSR